MTPITLKAAIAGLLLLFASGAQAATACDSSVSEHPIAPSPGDTSIWHLLSLPCQAPAGSTMADLINNNAISDDPSKWAAFGYQEAGSSGAYQPLSKSSPLPSPGIGFWFISTEPATLTMPDGSTQTAAASEAPCNSDQPCYEQTIEIQSDWNLIGNPTQQNVRYDEIKLTNLSTECTVSMPCYLTGFPASSAAFVYDASAQAYIKFDDGTNGTSVATPWDGYWFILDSEGVTDKWTLYTPAPPEDVGLNWNLGKWDQNQWQ